MEKRKKQILVTIAVLGVVFGGTLGAYFILCAAMNTTTPVVVVTSGSMEPTIYEGDILFVKNVPPSEIMPGSHVNRTGDVIVYDTNGLWLVPAPEPVVHRVINRTFVNGTYYFITEGDANPGPDPPGYSTPIKIPQNKVIGKVVGVIPKIGWVKLFLDQTNIAIPILVFLAILLVLSIVWDFLHPDTKKNEEKGVPPADENYKIIDPDHPEPAKE
ncbi:MAG TPA: signal peptidase I [Candidatus Lokiarchaeia archaeon]|nr:signal peptidase I [Candidatus Lokiarchaeia archaeon]